MEFLLSSVGMDISARLSTLMFCSLFSVDCGGVVVRDVVFTLEHRSSVPVGDNQFVYDSLRCKWSMPRNSFGSFQMYSQETLGWESNRESCQPVVSVVDKSTTIPATGECLWLFKVIYETAFVIPSVFKEWLHFFSVGINTSARHIDLSIVFYPPFPPRTRAISFGQVNVLFQWVLKDVKRHPFALIRSTNE